MPAELTPVDAYQERSLFGRCRFTLFADRWELAGHRNIGGVDFESSIRLAELSPDIAKLRLRHPWWTAGIVMQFVPFSMFFLLQAGKRTEHGFPWWLVALFWTIGVVFESLSLWLITAGFPKKEFYSFHRRNGLAAFNIGRVGPDRDRFDDFVANIQKTAAEALRG